MSHTGLDHDADSSRPQHPSGPASTRLEISSIAADPDSDWISLFTNPPVAVGLAQRDRTRTAPPSTPHSRHQQRRPAASSSAAGRLLSTIPDPASSLQRQSRDPRRGPPLVGASPSTVHGHLRFRSAEHAASPTPTDEKNRADKHQIWERARQQRKWVSERLNWLSDSEDSAASLPEYGRTPGPGLESGTEKHGRRHPSTAHAEPALLGPGSGAPSTGTRRARVHGPTASLDRRVPRRQLSIPTAHMMAERGPAPTVGAAEADKLMRSPPAGPSLGSADRSPEGPPSSNRIRHGSVQTPQRPKKKVMWKGKACIIALPLTDREAAGLPPLMTAQEIKDRMATWLAAGYPVSVSDVSDLPSSLPVQDHGQSRPMYPDAPDMADERKLRQYQVRIPDQAEWESWVNYVKEERLRFLGVSPSASEPPESSRSAFSPPLSRASSGFPGLTFSPPVAYSSPASNPPPVAPNNPFSPSLSSPGFSPQPVSMTSSQLSAYSKTFHPYKLPPAPANPYGGVGSPLDHVASQSSPLGTGFRVDAHPLLSRKTNLSPNYSVQLPNLGEFLSPTSQVNAPQAQIASRSRGLEHGQQLSPQLQGSPSSPPNHDPTVSSASCPQRFDSLPRTPDFRSSTTSLELAHPTPKSHRQNPSVALQRGVDQAEEAASIDSQRAATSPAPERKESIADETLQDDPPILRRPETMLDDRSDIETNPSIAATPMLMDDKNPFGTWQTTGAAGKTDSNFPDTLRVSQPASKLNVEAKEFDPQARFLSSNFSFGQNHFAPVEFGSSAPSYPIQNLPAVSHFSRSHLNADAPSFTPSYASPAAPANASFSFRSASFNVDAPVFNPSQSPRTNFRESVEGSAPGLPTSANTIFGEVVIDRDAKVSRRSTKLAAAVMPPKSMRGRLPDEGSASSDDESGRPMVPLERQKRARHDTRDEYDSPVVVDSSSFQQSHARVLSEIVDDLETNGPPPEIPKTRDEGWSYIPAENQMPADAARLDAAEPATQSEADKPTDADTLGRASQADQDDRENRDSVIGAQPRVDSMRRKSAESGSSSYEESRHSKSSLSDRANPFELAARDPAASTSPLRGGSPAALSLQPSSVRRSSSTRPSTSTISIAPSSPQPDLTQFLERQHDSGQEPDEDVVEVYEEDSTEDDNHQRYAERRSPLVVPPNVARCVDDEHEHHLDSIRTSAEPVPSFEEIDAVMKQFEEDPELGIERNDTPFHSTPQIEGPAPGTFRSDAPSPSPGRVNEPPDPSSTSLALGLGLHEADKGLEDIGDWGESLSAAAAEEEEAAKRRYRSLSFDRRVHRLVDDALGNRLQPLEQSLEAIRDELLSTRKGTKSKMEWPSASTERQESDADDEDDYDAFEGFASYRSRSPAARREGQLQGKIRAAVAEVLAAHQPPPQPESSVDVTELKALMQELRAAAHGPVPEGLHQDIKTVVEDVITHHPRLRGTRVQQDHEITDTKYKPQIDGLETMLQISREHASEEARLRRQADEKIVKLELRARLAEEEAAQHRESSEEAQQSLTAFLAEKESYRALEREVEGLNLSNSALQTTLDEYRESSDQWRDDIREEREKNARLTTALRELQGQLDNQTFSRHALRTKLEKLQCQMTQVVEDWHAEQADWRRREHDLLGKLTVVQGELEHERRRVEKAELELESSRKQNVDGLQLKSALARSESELSRQSSAVASLQEENRALGNKAFELKRDLEQAVNGKSAELATATMRLKAELESTQTQLGSIRSDSEAQIARLQSRVDLAELDLEDQKAKHDALFAETIEAHKESLREAIEKRELALEDQHQMHEKKFNDLRDRHTRELHNQFDNRNRLEHQLNERLSLSDDKVKHLEGKVQDLQERLDITKSAARAAVEAATAKGVDLPTPAPSVVASPPQRAPSASMTFVKDTATPEKISPQALRESIMVLQDQLQHREQKIEQLESELAEVDKSLPAKLKERENEVSWLRELVSVRVDDLEDIINTISAPDFDREAVRDAAIRLKANLQMEQQLNGRAPSALTSAFPSVSALTGYAQSPRALPLAAAAAWGNWRRARESSMGALSDLAANLGQQTPSKSTMGSPASLLSGIMTPPSTSQRAPESGSGDPSMPPPNVWPLASASQGGKHTREARPLRAYNTQARALSLRLQDKRRESSDASSEDPSAEEAPHTPVLSIRPALDLGDDVDEDASPLDVKSTRGLEDGEPLASRE